MFKKIINRIRGYVLIEISGIQKDRFINICSKKHILLRDMEKKGEKIYAYVSYKEYKVCQEYVKKTKTDIKVVKCFGLPFFIIRYRKRYGFIAGILLYFSMIYVFTMYIWDIEVSGDSVYTGEQIEKDIRDNYVDIFTKKSDINCDELEKALREKYSKVAWISCDIKGTCLNINITETIDKNYNIKSDKPCNIVAVKDGILTDIIVRTGKSTRSNGDEVKKGDIIITGTINLYNDYDELLETNYVSADGDVYAIVEYEYKDEFEMNVYDKVYTGKEKKAYDIVFDDVHIPVGIKADYELYDTVVTEHRLKLGSSIYLPVYFNKITSKEYDTVLCTYSEDEAEEKAKKRLQIYIEDLQKKGVEILENNVTIDVGSDKCNAKGTIVVKELIGVPEEINIINQGEEP